MNEEQTHSVGEDEWLLSLRDAGVQTPTMGADAPPAAPRLDRDRPVRRPLVPRGVWISAATLAAAVVTVTLAIVWISSRALVSVPDVVGTDLGLARTELQRVGLTIVVSEERFSSEPKDVILEQNPAAGSTIEPDEPIEVVVSAGTEEFSMPDVIGDGVALATGTLEEMGLVVEVERITSDAASDTVLSSVPAAGMTVRTGDVVRLQVASPVDPTADLRPFRLDGVTVVIDPSPVPAGITGDPVLEVARRLEAMISASGATVTVLRSSASTDTSDSWRAARAAESSATVAIGLSVAGTGEAGRLISVPPSATAEIGPAASSFGALVEKRLGASVAPVRRSESTYDPILTSSKAPWVRVLIGSATAREDAQSFLDPNWADRVARAVYSALGEAFGQAVTE